MAKEKQIVFEFRDTALQLDFECYLDAVGADGAKIIRKAIRKFIDLSLEENDGIRRDFNEFRTKRLPQGNNVSVLPRKGRKSKSVEAAPSHDKEAPKQGA